MLELEACFLVEGDDVEEGGFLFPPKNFIWGGQAGDEQQGLSRNKVMPDIELGRGPS